MVHICRCVLCVLFQQKKRSVCCEPLWYLVSLAVRTPLKSTAHDQKKTVFQAYPLFWWIVRTDLWIGHEMKWGSVRWLGFLGKRVGRCSYSLTSSSSNPLVQSEKGSSLGQSKLCWWVTEEVPKHMRALLPGAVSDGQETPASMNCQGEEQQSLPGKSSVACETNSLCQAGVKYGLHSNGAKFRARITLQQREAQVTVFISPFGLRQAFIQCWLGILLQQLTMRKNFS